MLHGGRAFLYCMKAGHARDSERDGPVHQVGGLTLRLMDARRCDGCGFGGMPCSVALSGAAGEVHGILALLCFQCI